MRRTATALVVLAGWAFAPTALAVEFDRKGYTPQGPSPTFKLATVLSCDNGNLYGAYFQNDVGRYGNRFSFGAGARLSSVEFTHYGYGFAGPYGYDIELWDLTSCTPITTVDGLLAADAAAAPMVESVNLCAQNLQLTGEVIVAIDANSCLVPTDCYPDVFYDNQVFAVCPYVVDASAGVCYEVSAQGGPFVLRVDIDNCPVPARPDTWGGLKQIYR